MLSFIVIASSGDRFVDESCVRLNVLSTSSRVMGRLSTVAQVSAEAVGDDDCDRQPAPVHARRMDTVISRNGSEMDAERKLCIPSAYSDCVQDQLACRPAGASSTAE
jgi:hypothetical protein